MHSKSFFSQCLHRGAIFESGIGHALANIHSGIYESFPHIPGTGQISGDGRLSIGNAQYLCEFKSETNIYPNFCFETHGANGRASALTEAAAKGFLWIHYHGGKDTLIIAKATRLLSFVQMHHGESGIQFKCGMGDGQRASGFLAPVGLIAGQPWVKTYPNFSGTFLTGSSSLNFNHGPDVRFTS